MIVQAVIDQLAADLNDPASVVWTREQLRRWLSEAAVFLAQNKPGLFNQTQVLELKSCVEYQEICPCFTLKPDSVLGQSTIDGHIIAPLTFRSDDLILRWNGASCSSRTKPFRLREFSISADGQSLRVFPAIPPRETVYLAVRCEVLPDFEDDAAEVPSEFAVIAVQWVLYRAKSMDQENNPVILQSAVDHKESFFILSGLVSYLPRARSRSKSNASTKTSQN
jgi:hypothetical protein